MTSFSMQVLLLLLFHLFYVSLETVSYFVHFAISMCQDAGLDFRASILGYIRPTNR